MLIFDQLKRSDRHLQLIAVVVLMGMCALVGRLWYVQIVSSSQYQEDLENQSSRSVRLPAVRGKILDRNGVALAENRPRYNVELYLEELSRSRMFQTNYDAEVKKTTAALGRPKLTLNEKSGIAKNSRYQLVSNIINQVSQIVQQPPSVDAEKFFKHYEQRLALPLTIATNLSPDQVARFVERAVNIPGVELELQPMRTYPHRTAAAHLLGYLQADTTSLEDEDSFFNYRLPDFKGVLGVEGRYDTELRGKAGSKSLLVNYLGYRQNENVFNQPQAGQNIVLTIDMRVQTAAENALRTVYANTRGAVVVLDVKTGDILAMVSAPSYDPNAFLPTISRAEYEKLIDEHLRPMVNRATHGAYPPGSIFKIVVALAALEAGELHPEETLYNPGEFWVGRHRVKDLAPPGTYDFKQAFIKSSNTYFIHHGLRIGPKKIIDMGDRFHLGDTMGVMPRQESRGEFPTMSDVETSWYDGNTANISIGQGPIAVTPMQMAVMTAAVANGGKVFWPRLVSRIERQETKEVVNEFEPAAVRNHLGVSAANLDIVRQAMLADVESSGTGTRAFVSGMSVCGKTGTAQITKGRLTIDHITWFVSFAPYEDPRYAVVVMVEGGASGGGTCAPVAQRVYQELQKIENLAKK